MLSDYINKEAVKNMTFTEFKRQFTGSPILSRYKIGVRDAYRELGGTLRKRKGEK